MPKFPHYLQPDAMDCGPTCLRIVAKHFGRHYNLETLRNLTWKTREGLSLVSTDLQSVCNSKVLKSFVRTWVDYLLENSLPDVFKFE
jgi:hypothetical protein